MASVTATNLLIKYCSYIKKSKGRKPNITQGTDFPLDDSVAASTGSDSTFGHHYLTQEDFEDDAVNTLRQIRQKSAASDVCFPSSLNLVILRVLKDNY